MEQCLAKFPFIREFLVDSLVEDATQISERSIDVTNLCVLLSKRSDFALVAILVVFGDSDKLRNLTSSLF